MTDFCRAFSAVIYAYFNLREVGSEGAVCPMSLH